MTANQAPHADQIASDSATAKQPFTSIKHEFEHDADIAVMLVTTQGRYSEHAEISGLPYIKYNDDYLVIAKNNKAQAKPDWYLNLREDPIIQIQLGEIRFYAKAETVTGAERLRLSNQTYQLDKNPTRTIPRDTAVVLLKPLF
jgi:deazaflavin-dependent oxidoreductase (nitroreductase family)